MFIVEAVENGKETYSEYETRYEALEEIKSLRENKAENITLAEFRRIDYTDAEIEDMLNKLEVTNLG